MSDLTYSQYPSTQQGSARPTTPGYRPVNPVVARVACGLGAPLGFLAAGICFYFLIEPFGTNPPPKIVALIAGIVFTCTALVLTWVALFYRGSRTQAATAERRLESLSGLHRTAHAARTPAPPDATPMPVRAPQPVRQPVPFRDPKPRRGFIPDLMGAIAVIGILVGPGLAYITFQRQKVMDMGKPEPHVLSVADLGKNGPGENIHVKITDFEFGENFAYKEKGGSWTALCLAAFPKGKRNDAKALRVVVRTTRVRNEQELRDFKTRPEIQGVVVNSIYEWESDKNYMKQAYPGVDTTRVWVVQENYTFPNQSEIKTMYTTSSGIVGLAVFCGLGFFMGKKS
jgi:hypothetical protein